MARDRARRRALTFVTLWLPLLSSSVLVEAPAFAQSPAARTSLGTEAQLAEARRHFEQGVALYERADYAIALAEFQAAYDTAQAATILYNIGLTFKALRRYPEAIETLERYLGSAAKDGLLRSDRRRQVGKLIDEMKGLLVPVTFTITPPGAELRLDGEPVLLPRHGTMPLSRGQHVALVSAPGHQQQQRDFTVAAVPLVLTFELEPKHQTGKVRVTSSQPGTSVVVDGQEHGLAPLEVELPAGAHQLLARREGFTTFRGELFLDSGQERNLDLTLSPDPDRAAAVYKRWWFWTGLGAALAGGTVAALLLRPGEQAPLAGSLSPSVRVGVIPR